MKNGNSRTEQWWRGACLYEVYLRSFADSNGDGEGDLPGLRDRLDYIAALGVDGIWITPFFPSPMYDSGYDVADYRSVDPRFGTLADFRSVTSRAHELGLRVIIDQVYSHTSHLHPWFVESASSADNPKADWYVWADPKPDGSLPNNWLARFGGVAWEWNANRRQYYLHNFLVEQPDLNLHNRQVQDEILDTMRFWVDQGVDGFRLDVANFYMHDPQMRDNPPVDAGDRPANPYYMQRHVHDRSRPENLAFLERMRAATGEHMLLAEISCDNQAERMAEYTEPGRLHTAYSFELLGPVLDGAHIARTVATAGAGQSWPTWAFSNHDVARVATRWNAVGNRNRVNMLQALLLSLRGTVIVYQGEELGLAHGNVPREALRDPEAVRFWPHGRGRDGARTPMAWDDTPMLGFSKAPGWLPAEPGHAEQSIARQSQDPCSSLAHCRSMIALRKTTPALKLGEFEVIEADETGLSFWRVHEGARILCSFNFTGQSRAVPQHGRSRVLAGAFEGDGLAADGYVIAEAAA